MTATAPPPPRRPEPTAAPCDDETLPPPGVNPESSYALVMRARGGDDDALNDLFERYARRLRVWAHGRLPAWARGPADTADIVQDTLLQVIRKLGAFEPRHEGAFLGYVRMTLRNNITDRIRQARRRGSFDPLASTELSPDASPEDEAIAAELLDRYETALARLSPAQREAIIARVELRLSWPEVTTALNKPSVPAAQMTVSRALVCLAKEMAHDRRR